MNDTVIETMLLEVGASMHVTRSSRGVDPERGFTASLTVRSETIAVAHGTTLRGVIDDLGAQLAKVVQP